MSHKWTRGEYIGPRNDALKATNGERRPQGGESWGETLAVGAAMVLLILIGYAVIGAWL